LNAIKTVVACLLLWLGLAVRGEAQTFTLSASADTYVRESPANQNRGGESTLHLAKDSHVLVRFDQGALVSTVNGGRLVSASLELFVHSASNNWGSDGRPVEAHRLTADWTEVGATWNCAIDTNPGNNKQDCAAAWNGGTFDDDATDTVLQTKTEGTWVQLDVTADVAAFLTGTPNDGWSIVKTDEDQAGNADYVSKEGAAAQRPRLVLLVETAAHDQVPPSLAITSPDQPVLANPPSPAVVVEYADGGSGVDTATLQVSLDGQAIPCTAGPSSASCPMTGLAAGNHTLQAGLRDHAGNAAQASFAFQVLLGPGPHVVTFQSVGDTYIRKGDANKNFGAEPIVRVRESGANRALVQFDAASLANALTGATLVSASLELHVEKNGRNWGKTGRTVEAHRLTAAWTETGATWNCPNDSNTTNDKVDCAAQWAGGSFAAAPTASVLHTRDLTGWVRYDVTADVAAFATGTANRGWLLKKTEENKSGRVDYDSREGTSGEGPRLVVVFTTPVNGDTTPPTVAIAAPVDGSLLTTSTPAIQASFSDGGSGIDPASLHLLVDGVDRTAEAQVSGSGLSFTLTPPLAEGAHTVAVTIRDRAGNAGGATAGFSIDTIAPDLAITEPASLTLNGVTTTPISVTYSDTVAGVDPATLQIVLDDVDLTAGCTVGSAAATCQTSGLTAGTHSLATQIKDRVGNLASTGFTFAIVLDEQAPTLAITAPNLSLIMGNASPAVRVEYSDADTGVDLSSLRILLDGSALAGCQVGPAFTTCQPSALQRGTHILTAQIADQRGNVANARFDFTLSFPLAVAFTQPAPDFLTGVALVQVAGTVAPEASSVTVNGVNAEVSGGTFQIQSLGLHDGVNNLVAVAADAAGNVGTATVRVIVDVTRPTVAITFPVDGTAVSTPAVTVTGLVNDLTIGTVSDTHATVTVNGIPAAVVNRSFMATGVPLTAGPNTLTAVATDRAGNHASASIQVTLESRTGVPSLQALSGDGQSATIATTLPAPLVVGVTDAAGQPLPNAQVVFQVTQGNGVLEGGSRSAVLHTDAQGRAVIHWTLGSRAGVGVDRIRATAVGVAGAVTFSATALTGSAAAIDVTSGDSQRGSVGEQLWRPLFVVVTDEGHNPVPGVHVTFQAVEGGGTFVESGGAASATADTDDSGLASVRLVLGPTSGLDNNLVEASFEGLATLPAAFKASAFVLGDPAQTAISGVILDNQGDPVPGVTLRLRSSTLTATSNAQGQFHLGGVPLGQVFLIADASTTTRPGHWASLEYEMFALAGIDNTLPRPIYILPLDIPNGVMVDETRGGTVTLPEVPGFSLQLVPGSVTFPGGSRSGVVSVTAVHVDRVPMPPGAGMQPRLIVTIQPVGARFDPPAPMTLPNVDGLAPGTVTELFSFDHDIGEFVSIGTGTVSEDGLAVRSDPGFGILQAGWHCGAPPRGRGAGSSLAVKLTPRPIKVKYGDADTKVTATGTPPLDGEYINWTIENQTYDKDFVKVRFKGQPNCASKQTCDNHIESVQLNLDALQGQGRGFKVCGTADAKVTFRCLTTGSTVTDKVTLEHGCAGKSASACQSICNSTPAQGMCGTPCSLTGMAHPGFDPNSGACWRTKVAGTWYCYWDHRDAAGTGFENLCCPNRCFGGSFTVWGQGPGKYECTVIETCTSNPAFGRVDSDGDPGVNCAKVN